MRYKVLGFEESGVKILVYLMRSGNAIRKYYSFSTIIGASEPTKAKRPYLSIIRQLTKRKYKLNSYDYRIKQDGKEDIRTKKICF